MTVSSHPQRPNSPIAARRTRTRRACSPSRRRDRRRAGGLSLAVDLAQRGIPVVVLDDSDRVGEGSRAICFAKRTLEIFDRLGVGERSLAKGVQWQVGKVFHKDRLLYQFDLLPEAGHKMPAFINLQQFYAEQYLIERTRGTHRAWICAGATGSPVWSSAPIASRSRSRRRMGPTGSRPIGSSPATAPVRRAAACSVSTSSASNSRISS